MLLPYGLRSRSWCFAFSRPMCSYMRCCFFFFPAISVFSKGFFFTKWNVIPPFTQLVHDFPSRVWLWSTFSLTWFHKKRLVMSSSLIVFLVNVIYWQKPTVPNVLWGSLCLMTRPTGRPLTVIPDHLVFSQEPFHKNQITGTIWSWMVPHPLFPFYSLETEKFSPWSNLPQFHSSLQFHPQFLTPFFLLISFQGIPGNVDVSPSSWSLGPLAIFFFIWNFPFFIGFLWSGYCAFDWNSKPFFLNHAQGGSHHPTSHLQIPCSRSDFVFCLLDKSQHSLKQIPFFVFPHRMSFSHLSPFYLFSHRVSFGFFFPSFSTTTSKTSGGNRI